MFQLMMGRNSSTLKPFIDGLFICLKMLGQMLLVDVIGSDQSL